jgi:hypothetical protein
MKALVCALVLCFVLAGVVAADAPNKVTLDAKAMTVKDATEQVAKQAGVSIVLDPKAKGTVTASLSGAELSQVLDVIAKSNNLTWKRLEFARKEDSKVSLDQLKTGILALASMQLVGLSVVDPATKTSTVFAKDIPSAPQPAKPALPEGYSWSTVYVMLAPEPVAAPSADKDKLTQLTKNGLEQMMSVANLSQGERQQYFQNQWAETMKLAPEARQGMLRDQMQAMSSLDPASRDQLRQDFHSVFGGQRGQGGPLGQGGHGNHGN